MAAVTAHPAVVRNSCVKKELLTPDHIRQLTCRPQGNTLCFLMQRQVHDRQGIIKSIRHQYLLMVLADKQCRGTPPYLDTTEAKIIFFSQGNLPHPPKCHDHRSAGCHLQGRGVPGGTPGLTKRMHMGAGIDVRTSFKNIVQLAHTWRTLC